MISAARFPDTVDTAGRPPTAAYCPAENAIVMARRSRLSPDPLARDLTQRMAEVPPKVVFVLLVGAIGPDA
jgi:hypothetical protein